MSASILRQLLALHFAIIYSWQLSSSEKSLVWKKKLIHIFQGLYRYRFLLHKRFLFYFLWQMPVLPIYLFKNYPQTFWWLGKHPSFHLKVTKIWFGPNIKYLLEPLFADFSAGKAFLVNIQIHLLIFLFAFFKHLLLILKFVY